MGLLSEFKTFIQRGNVIDLAVGVIIGASFGKVVSSLVEHVIMPPIGLLVGNTDFITTFDIPIGSTVDIKLGIFLQAVVDFLIIAFCVFLLVKAVNTLNRFKDAPPKSPLPSPEERLLTEIRDILKAKS